MADIPFPPPCRTQASVAILQSSTFDFVSASLYLNKTLWRYLDAIQGIKSHPQEAAFILKWSKYLLVKQSAKSAHFRFFLYFLS